MGIFSWFRPPSAPDEIYASSLRTLHLGHALWFPEPHGTGEPQIGDVGFVDEGAFIRLFNLDTSVPEKKVTFWDPPFKITEHVPANAFKVDSRPNPLVPKDYPSHGVESKQMDVSAEMTASANVSVTFGTSYTCKAAQGAVLVLKSEAHAEKVYGNRLLKKYIVQHCDKWYAYTRDVIFQDVKQEDIVVVSGWVKTAADWAAVAFSNTSTSSSVSLKGHAGGIAGAAVGGSHSRSMTGPRMERQGQNYLKKPSDPPLTKSRKKKAKASASHVAEAKRDQCVLVKRYKIRKRLGVLKKVVAGAGYDRPPDSGDGQGASGVGVTAREDEDEDIVDILGPGSEGGVADPLDILLDYILEISDVEVAIASDDDVESIVGSNSVVDFGSYLRQVQPPVDIDGTLGSICVEDVLRHERQRACARRTITASDLAIWPNISLHGAGRLVDWHVFVSRGTRPLTRKSSQLAFTDPQLPRAECKCHAMSTDGKLLAASFSSADTLVWRLSDGLLVQRLHHQGHGQGVTSLSFSPNSRALVTAYDDGIAIVWDIQRGCVLRRLVGHRGGLDVAAYAPDGARVVTADWAIFVKIWDVSTGACLDSFKPDSTWRINQFTFSPDSSRLCIRTFGPCFIYDMQSYKCVAVLQHNNLKARKTGCSMSRQGDHVVTATYDSCNGVKIWNTATGKGLLTVGNERKLSCPVAFSPDGAEVLAACPADKTALAYDSRTGLLRRNFKPSFTPRCVAYSPNGDYVAFANQQGSLEIYGAKSGTFIGKGDGPMSDAIIGEVVFSPDSQNILACFSRTSHEFLRLYNIQDLVRMR